MAWRASRGEVGAVSAGAQAANPGKCRKMQQITHPVTGFIFFLAPCLPGREPTTCASHVPSLVKFLSRSRVPPRWGHLQGWS